MKNSKMYRIVISENEVNNLTDNFAGLTDSVGENVFREDSEKFEKAYKDLSAPIYLTIIETRGFGSSENIRQSRIVCSKSISNPQKKKMTKQEIALAHYNDKLRLFCKFTKGEIGYQEYSAYDYCCWKMKLYKLQEILKIYSRITSPCWYGDNALVDEDYELLHSVCMTLAINYQKILTKDLSKVKERGLSRLLHWNFEDTPTDLRERLLNGWA